VSFLLIVKSRAMHQGNRFSQLLSFANLSQPSPAVVFSFSTNLVNGVRCCRACPCQACPVSSTSMPWLRVSPPFFRRGWVEPSLQSAPLYPVPWTVAQQL
jgi:hypothetical protein